MKKELLLDIKISHQNTFSSDINEITLISALNEIKSDKHKKYTKYLRSFYKKSDNVNYSKYKKRLSGVTFCGSFEGRRRKENLKKYNNLIVLDIDKLGNDELARVKKALFEDKYVFSFWESPSQDGVKGLVHLEYNFDITKDNVDASHRAAFNKLIDYFENNYNIILDVSGSDITRFCFISWDDMLVIKENITSFAIKDVPFPTVITKKSNNAARNFDTFTNKVIKNLLNNPKGKNKPIHRKTMKDIIIFLKKNSFSITNNYDDWYRVSFAISNSFTYDIGLKYFVSISKLDPTKFCEDNCKTFLLDCYKNNKGDINFSTIIHFAKEKGFVYKYGNAKST
ncbi:Primase C terminal 2 (PriCT-2) [Candidatus Electrothrix aarhusensis]